MEIKEKVRLQDIAQMAGISRNTVSKILNGRYRGSPRVKELVLELIREHNYKGMAQVTGREEKELVRTILLLCKEGISSAGFFPYLLNGIQKKVEEKGYILQFYSITQEELLRKRIPDVIVNRQVDGIVCMEIFDKIYVQKLVAHHLPLVFLEFCYDMWSIPGGYDIVLMNSEFPVYTLTKQLIAKGCENIGFVGDFTHCRGFYERYQGYCRALAESGLPFNQNLCITYADEQGYDGAELWRRFNSMSSMPDAFVAANDAIGIRLVQMLMEHGIRVPEDIRIVGFDNTTEAFAMRPSLTTVDGNREALSKNVVECLLQRMADPQKPKSVVYVDSEIIYQESFGK